MADAKLHRDAKESHAIHELQRLLIHRQKRSYSSSGAGDLQHGKQVSACPGATHNARARQSNMSGAGEVLTYAVRRTWPSETTSNPQIVMVLICSTSLRLSCRSTAAQLKTLRASHDADDVCEQA